MVDKTFLHWPFFGDEHRDVRLRLKEFISRELCAVDHGNIDQACKKLVSALGGANFLIYTGDPTGKLDVRTLCLIRETLAYHDGLADFSFAMQGLGSGAISLYGSEEQKQEWLTKLEMERR